MSTVCALVQLLPVSVRLDFANFLVMPITKLAENISRVQSAGKPPAYFVSLWGGRRRET